MRWLTTELDGYDVLTAEEHRSISHSNAWTLFRHLAPQHDTAPPERRSARSGR